MSFPSSPLNNEIAVVNNITYKYVSSTNTWNRIATSNVGFVSVTANTITSNNYLYVSGINFHDDNLNVIMKTQLAQPIMKRFSEKLLFKVKYDF